jgi:hypothetical protein
MVPWYSSTYLSPHVYAILVSSPVFYYVLLGLVVNVCACPSRRTTMQKALSLVLAGTSASAAIAIAADRTLHVGSCAGCTHATLSAARDHIRRNRSRARGDLVAAAVPFEVVVHEGTYEPLVLDDAALDSHVAYRGHNADGEATPVISAGVPIPATEWSAAGAGFPAGTLLVNVTALGLSLGGPLPDTGTTCCDICDQETQLTAQLFHSLPGVVATQPLLARYPNAGEWLAGSLDSPAHIRCPLAQDPQPPLSSPTCLSPLPTPPPDGINWLFLHAKDQALGPDGTTPVGLVPADADAARVVGWMKEEAAYVHGYWEWDWADGITHVRSGQTTAGSDSTSNAKPAKATVAGTLRDDAADSGAILYWATNVTQSLKPNARYVGLNLLSELDVAGEYHVSRATGLLHYLPAAPPSSWSQVDGSVPVWSVSEAGLSFAAGVSSVAISGITVSHATSVGIVGAWRRLAGVVKSACHCFSLLASSPRPPSLPVPRVLR